MSELFKDGWPVDAIFDKYENGQELKGQEALAFLAAQFSNATHGNYEAELLLERISTNFTITIKK